MVSILREATVTSSEPPPSPAHLLLQAARRGEVAAVSAVLSDASPSVAVSDPLTQSGRTLLHIAAHHGHLGVTLAAYTQVKGVDVNITNKVRECARAVCARIACRDASQGMWVQVLVLSERCPCPLKVLTLQTNA